LHFLPALSIRSNGAIATSWYDRQLTGPDSARTDYFAEIRPTPTGNTRDNRITTSNTDWANTSTGTTTYYTWSDGRIGVPQPFIDSR
jgi:hypothetical protein